MAAETTVARQGQSNPTNALGSTRSNIAKSVSRGISSLSQGNDSRIDFKGGSVILEERESRDYSRTGEPWIVQGANTIYADFPRQDFTLRYTYTSNKEDARRLGLYSSRRQAVAAMRKDLTSRIKNLTR